MSLKSKHLALPLTLGLPQCSFLLLGWVWGYCFDSLRHFMTFFVNISDKRPVSWKSQKRFGPEKPFLKLRPAYSVKLVFWYVVKGIQFKITAKFLILRRLRFEDTKRTMSPKIRPKSVGTFKKQAPGVMEAYWGQLASTSVQSWT